jgi:hypothetical protein
VERGVQHQSQRREPAYAYNAKGQKLSLTDALLSGGDEIGRLAGYCSLQV